MKITLYTDTEARDLTRHATAVAWTTSTRAPYLNASVTLAAPFALLDDLAPAGEGALSLDGWIAVSDTPEGEAVERALFVGPLTGASYTFSAESSAGMEGLRRLDALTLTAGSMLHYMSEAQLTLSARPTAAPPGHIYTLQTWAATMRALITAPFSGPYIGAALARTFSTLAAPYRLPRTLAGGLSLSAIPIAYDAATTSTHAPERAGDARALTGAAINAVSAAAAPSGSPWGLLTSIFDPDPSIAELFLSLEPDPTKRHPLGAALNSRPVLLHRFKPFASGALASGAALGALDAPGHPTTRALLLDGVMSLRAAQTDADRINGAYISTPLTASRGVDSFGLIATPRLDPVDIERAGLRLYRAQWPYFPPGKKEGSYSAHSQYLVDITEQITAHQERFMNGDILARYAPHLRAGVWLKTPISDGHRERLLYAYAESLNHTIQISDGGLITRRTSISYTRGFYA